MFLEFIQFSLLLCITQIQFHNYFIWVKLQMKWLLAGTVCIVIKDEMAVELVCAQVQDTENYNQLLAWENHLAAVLVPFDHV